MKAAPINAAILSVASAGIVTQNKLIAGLGDRSGEGPDLILVLGLLLRRILPGRGGIQLISVRDRSQEAEAGGRR